MASIDRYRPPREGYQPPTLPGAARDNNNNDRSSRSPTRRREVPPAAPTPPQTTSYMSPPRPQARAAQTSPSRSRSGGAQTPLASSSQWYFTTNEVLSTPTILEGTSPSEERLRRAKGVNFIYQAGVMLDLPQITLWVASVFFHRIYMRLSMSPEKGGIHHYNIAATALFLANKVEENCRKTKDIIITVAKVAQKNSKLIIDEQSKEYWRWRDSILTYEEVMLEQLTFDLMVDNPYHHLFELLGRLEIVHNKHLRQAAWAFCNDAGLTAMPLLIEARDVAIAAIFFASVHTGQLIDDLDGEPWWRFLKGDEGRCTKAIEVMQQFYTENPLRKQNPSLPSPAFHLEQTRRRPDVLPSQTDTVSSNAGTPMEIDRASRSPGGRMNGGGDRDNTREPAHRRRPSDGESASQQSQSQSQGKRKEADLDAGSEGARAEKRPRLPDEDEGEVIED